MVWKTYYLKWGPGGISQRQNSFAVKHVLLSGMTYLTSD